MTDPQIEEDRHSECLAWLLTNKPQPSPCFVLDVEKLRLNAAILADIQQKTGVRILLALKAFACWSLFPLLSRAFSGPLWGTCASSVDEAILGHEQFGGETHAFAAAWDEREIRELIGIVDHITFNSPEQWLKFAPHFQHANKTTRKNNPIHCGLRLNPEHSEGAAAIYNPCAPGSRLGIRNSQLPAPQTPFWNGLSGLHFHTLCEQNADALQRTLRAFETKFGPWLKHTDWLNWGGGHHITRHDYDRDRLCQLLLDWQKKYPGQIYLEPGEAVALNAGWLQTTVLDIVQADVPIAILNASAACHMPDVLEMPYTPRVWQLGPDNRPGCGMIPGKGQNITRLAGKSCLAGDVIGEYVFEKPLQIGDTLIFADMAIYSMVKTTTFNGLSLPAIASWSPDRFKIIREFGYDDFKNRLS